MFTPKRSLAVVLFPLAFACHPNETELASSAQPLISQSGWTMAPTLPAPTIWHTVTGLLDGRALIRGGHLPVLPSNSPHAWIYSPAAGAYLNLLTSPQYYRINHASLRLTNGRVLTVGGQGPSGGPSTRAEIFNPDTTGFYFVRALEYSRRDHSMIQVASGDVLVVGGVQMLSGSFVHEVERFDLSTEEFTTIGHLIPGRRHPRLVELPGGVAVVGGGDDYASDEVTLIDPVTGYTNPLPPLQIPRSGHNVAKLADGRILVSGGVTTIGNPEVYADQAEIYDPAGIHSELVPQVDPRAYHLSEVLTNGEVIIFGGRFNPTEYIFGTSTQVFEPATKLFYNQPTLQLGVGLDGASTLLRSGDVYTAGGWIPNFMEASPYAQTFSYQNEGPAETPLQSFVGYTPTFSGLPFNFEMGFQFRPSVSGRVFALGGYFDGTKTVRLYNHGTGALLAETVVAADNHWRYEHVPFATLAAGQIYTVSVSVAGTGGAAHANATLPVSSGAIDIIKVVYGPGGGEPQIEYSAGFFLGMADIGFDPD